MTDQQRRKGLQLPRRRGSDRPRVKSTGEGGKPDWRRVLQRRLAIAAIGFGCWAVAIEARLVYLQVVTHDELVLRAERQQLRTVVIPAKRGDIVDRHGRVLAYSVDAETIYAVPTDIDNPDRTAAAICRALDDCRERDERALRDRLGRQRAFAFVRRQVWPDEARRVAALNLPGIGFLKENRRYFPKKELAAHLLGYVGIDNNGLNGVEAVYERQIRGEPGQLLAQADALHRAFSRLERPPTAGATLELTIDEYLQHIAERELRIGVEENRATGGSIVIMDPQTGEILAMANEPTFNPNEFSRFSDSDRRNRAIQDLYEPGSTFKLVTASAALEEKIVTPDDPIDVGSGAIRFGSRLIEDVHQYGVLSFTDVIVKSSNIGAIKVGLKLGPERLGRYIRRYGFGQVFSRDFAGQSTGIVWDAARLSDSALASVSMGYQIGVTPLQMVTAVSAVANGGELLEPHLVRAVWRTGRRRDVQRRVIRRTIAPETADVVTTIMESVVERGTARRAQLDDYMVAGKTGTSAKLVNGHYSKSEYNASFVGFVPSRKPALTILVVIDSPHGHGYMGGVIAAPIFKRVAEAALRHLGIGSTLHPSPPVLVAQATESDGLAPVGVKMPASVRPALVAVKGIMPDLRGLSARECLRVLTHLGLAPRVIGDGLVVAQEPPPGSPIDEMTWCELSLKRQPVASGGAAP
ncbi:MAG: transpeptidase family protein [Acidobacteria bacterium]|nr:transpeptidase family protein [Acidobacteriota bacterium]